MFDISQQRMISQVGVIAARCQNKIIWTQLPYELTQGDCLLRNCTRAISILTNIIFMRGHREYVYSTS